MACSGYEELRSWFLDKMVNICRSIRDQKEEQSNSAVKKAMLYIQENFSKDISLDEVSGQVISVLIISARSSRRKQERTSLNILPGPE